MPHLTPNAIESWLTYTDAASLNSSCTRLQVACTILACGIVSESRVRAITRTNRVNGSCSGAEGLCGCTHAERRAIDSFRQHGPEQFEHVEVFVTHSPCARCAEALLQLAGDAQATMLVHYLNQYRNTDGIHRLSQVGIEVIHHVKI